MQKTFEFSASQEEVAQAKAINRRNRTWQIIYVSLFTSLLAFFILIVSLVELEGSAVKRNHQKLVHFLYESVLDEKNRIGMPWLDVENTLSKGIKLSMDAKLFESASLFESARAKINPRFLPYLNELAGLIKQVELETFPRRHQKLIRQLQANGFDFIITVRIEGHTDSQPLAQTALFANNIELSTFRAYAVMDLLRIYTGLPKKFFSIAGYGSFYPLVSNSEDATNRRVEVYLLPQVIPQQVKS